MREERIPLERWGDAARRRRARRERHAPALPAVARTRAEHRVLQRNGLDPGEFEEIYWGRWFYPINVLALCLAAVPFAFGSLRSGGWASGLFIGIVFALGFWMLQTMFGNLAQAFRFDIRIAYMLPLAVMLGVSAWLFRRRSGYSGASRFRLAMHVRAACAVVPRQRSRSIHAHQKPSPPASSDTVPTANASNTARATSALFRLAPRVAQRHGRIPSVYPPRCQLSAA